MAKFGKTSMTNLESCHPDLQKIFNEVIKTWDCSVIEGHRSKERQDKLHAAGQSKLSYPKSKHNASPSLAVDVVPYPVDWDDTGRFYMFAGYVMRVAEELGIGIRYGGDWDGDGNTDDQTFNDLPHFELR